MNKHFIATALISSLLTLTACGGGGSSTPSSTEQPNSNTNESPVVDAGNNASIMEGDSYSFSATASDPENSSLTYLWTQTSGSDVSILNENTLAASFVSGDITQTETLQFKLTATDSEGKQASDVISIEVVPYTLSLSIPPTIGEGCEFTFNINQVEGKEINSIQWSILSNTNELVVDGDSDNPIISTIIPDSGEFSLNAEVTILSDSNVTAEVSSTFTSNKVLPQDIKSENYVIAKNETYLLCGDVNVWQNATLFIEEGAKLVTIDENKVNKIFMWGGVALFGTEDNRISVSNVVFENDFFSTNANVTFNAQYVDFSNFATVINDDGVTNINYSSFSSKYSQEDKGSLSHNIFHKGISIKPDGAIIRNNDIYCEGIESCISIASYMFGDGNINAKPLIEYNNIYNAGNNSITYDSDSFTNADIDLMSNYWGGISIDALSDVFVDANDVPDKSYVFLYEPMLQDKVIHTEFSPTANAFNSLLIESVFGVIGDVTVDDGLFPIDDDGSTIGSQYAVLNEGIDNSFIINFSSEIIPFELKNILIVIDGLLIEHNASLSADMTTLVINLEDRLPYGSKIAILIPYHDIKSLTEGTLVNNIEIPWDYVKDPLESNNGYNSYAYIFLMTYLPPNS
jgi:hypothetical protein